MSDDLRGDNRDPRLSSGAYALDAISQEENDAFEAAAATSGTLRDEAEELRETATLLGLAARPVRPSEGLKAELMAKLSSTPQVPREAATAAADAVPAAGGHAPAHAAAPAFPAPGSTVPGSSVPGSTAPGEPAPMPAPGAAPVAPAASAASAPSTPPPGSAPVLTPSTPPGAAERRAAGRWFSRPVSILVAAAAAVALFVGGGVVGGALVNGTLSPASSDASGSGLAEIAAAGDAQRATVAVEGGGTATLVWSNELGRSAVLADGLPTLPEGKVYEAWYIDADGATPAGTFAAADSGTSWHVLNGTMAAGDTVGVTVEPAGGSDAPTTDPVIVVQSA